MGYLGGGILFLLNVVMTLNPLVRSCRCPEAVRWSFLTVHLVGVLHLLTLSGSRNHAPRGSCRGIPLKSLAQSPYLQGNATPENPDALPLCLLVYMDGVDTIVRMAVDYGMSIGFASTDLITALLLVQFVGFQPL